jgi:hypothetical protein
MKKSISVALPLAAILLLVVSCSSTREFDDGPSGGTAGAAGAMASGGSSGADGGTAGSGGMAATGTAGSGGMGGTGGGSEPATNCNADEKSCDGACVAISDPAYGCDPTLCSASRCPEAEGATLACEAGECVIAACGPAEKKCNGTCVSLTDPTFGCGAETCDASSCPSQATGATLVCEEGQCVIGGCPGGYKLCDDKCVAITDPTYGCGATSCDDSACPAVGSGTVVCEGGACVLGSCGAGTKDCDGRCVTTDANNGCADPSTCDACASNEACSGSPSTCQCAPTVKATACSGKCGSIPNGCGGMHACGNCTSPQTCGGGGTANVCGCTNTPLGTACSGKSCGPVSNGCGGTYMCGSCTSSSLPECVNNACVQCVALSDCPAGSFDCSNNACVCRPPSSANVFPDAGFDNEQAFSNNWTRSQATWNSGDADGCPGSGSVMVTGTMSRCFQNAVGGVQYVLGFKYKQASDSGSGCYGGYYQDLNCSEPAGGADFLNAGASTASVSWVESSNTGTSPANTRSISVECHGGGATMNIDQIYLRRPGQAGSGF